MPPGAYKVARNAKQDIDKHGGICYTLYEIAMGVTFIVSPVIQMPFGISLVTDSCRNEKRI